MSFNGLLHVLHDVPAAEVVLVPPVVVVVVDVRGSLEESAHRDHAPVRLLAPVLEKRKESQGW